MRLFFKWGKVFFFIFSLTSILLSISACSPASQLATITPTTNPTITYTPTKSPSPTPTFTPTPDYSVDPLILRNFPESYESFLQNPDAYVKCPINPIDNPVEFRNWLIDRLSPALGDKSTREQNLMTTGTAILAPVFTVPIFPHPTKVQGKPTLFYFEYDGIKYPVVMFNVWMNGANWGVENGIKDYYLATVAITIDVGDTHFNDTNMFKAIAEGNKIFSLDIFVEKQPFYPNIYNKMVDAGFVGANDDVYNSSGILIGAGIIKIVKNDGSLGW